MSAGRMAGASACRRLHLERAPVLLLLTTFFRKANLHLHVHVLSSYFKSQADQHIKPHIGPTITAISIVPAVGLTSETADLTAAV